jgi:hypothetical protein
LYNPTKNQRGIAHLDLIVAAVLLIGLAYLGFSHIHGRQSNSRQSTANSGSNLAPAATQSQASTEQSAGQPDDLNKTLIHIDPSNN